MTVMTSRGVATGFTRENVCPAPCDQIVDARDGAEFFFTAPNMTPSRAVKLTPYDGEIEARVRGGSLSKRIAGAWLLIGGVTSGIFGVIMLPIGLAANRDNFAIGGGIALGAGAALGVPGTLLVLTSGTTVEIVPRTEKSAGVRFENGMLRF